MAQVQCNFLGNAKHHDKKMHSIKSCYTALHGERCNHGEEHDFVATLEQVCTPRPDLKETPLENADLILFVDGSASRDPKTRKNRAGYAVTTAYATITSGALPTHCSAQAAELVALTETCKIAEGQTVTIYTDSRNSFGVCHDFGALWKHRKFLKSDGKPVLNHDRIAALLEAILLPKSIAICKCVAHSKSDDFVSLGNKRADAAAKDAAIRAEPSLICVTDKNDSHSLLILSQLCKLLQHQRRRNNRPTSIVVGPEPRPLPSTALCEDDMLNYCRNLSLVLSQISQQVKEALPKPAEGVLHDIRPGDFVVTRDLRRKHWKSKRWNGPFQVLLITHTAVKVAPRATWVHASHCRKVPAPQEGTTDQ